MDCPPAQTRRISAETGKTEIAQERRSGARRSHDEGKAEDRPGTGWERIHEALDNLCDQIGEPVCAGASRPL